MCFKGSIYHKIKTWYSREILTIHLCLLSGIADLAYGWAVLSQPNLKFDKLLPPVFTP